MGVRFVVGEAKLNSETVGEPKKTVFLTDNGGLLALFNALLGSILTFALAGEAVVSTNVFDCDATRALVSTI